MSETDPGECARVQAQIEAYLDGELDTVACGPIEEHCRECAACGALVKGLRQTVDLCRDAGHAPLPEPVRDRARRRMHELLEGRRRGRMPS